MRIFLYASNIAMSQSLTTGIGFNIKGSTCGKWHELYDFDLQARAALGPL